MLSVGQFQIFTSKSGALSAKHTARSVLIHSAIDPIIEARTVASRIATAGVRTVTLIGCGLGYLERELFAHRVEVTAIELHANLYELRKQLVRDTQSSGYGKDVRLCGTVSELREILTMCGADRMLCIAPYVTTLADELPREIAAELLAQKVMDASRTLYQPLIAANEKQNAAAIRGLPRLNTNGRSCSRIALAVGAGPSLSGCMETIKAARSELLVIAASGAVPVLRANDISPDWTIALEARESLAHDADMLEDGAKVIVFPWSMPAVVGAKRLDVYLADEQTGLATSGGTSSLTAADFAFKITRGNVYLLGMDLSDTDGAYATGALRANVSGQMPSPKYASMRVAFEEWLKDHREHRVFQVIGENVTPLRGVRAINHQRFAEDLVGDMSNSELM